MSNAKVNEVAICPYCGDEGLYTFYYGEETLLCNKCRKEFAIKLESVIKVKSAKIYNKVCFACNTYLHDDELVNGNCPKCGCGTFEKNKFKESEFDIKQHK